MFKKVRLIPALALLLLAFLAQGAQAAILPQAFSSSAPGVAAFNNLLYVFYSTASGSLLRYRYMNLSGVWSGEGTIVGANTDDGPGAAVFNGLLYLFWETAGSGSDSIRYVTVNTSNAQSGVSVVPFGLTFRGPAATVFNNRIYLSYSGTNGSPANGSPLYYGYMDANGTWIGDSQPTGSPRSVTGPTLAALGTQMWLIYLPKTIGFTNDLYFKKLDTLNVWTSESLLAPLTESDTGVSSVSFNGHIWVVGTTVGGTNPHAVQYSIL